MTSPNTLEASAPIAPHQGELSAKPTEGVNGARLTPPHGSHGSITFRPAAWKALVSLDATAKPCAAAIAAM